MNPLSLFRRLFNKERSVNKELRALIKEIEAKGFTVDRENGRYYKVRTKGGGYVYSLPATPGRGRWMQNLRAELRRRDIL